MLTSIFLLASLLTDASRQLSAAEFAVEQLGGSPETAAEAETFRKQLPELAAAWAREEVELVDATIAAGDAPLALARAFRSYRNADLAEHRKPQRELLAAARDRAATATLEMGKPVAEVPLSDLPKLTARALWVVETQPGDTDIRARGFAIRRAVVARLEERSAEAQRRQLPFAAELVARIAEAYGSTKGNLRDLATAAKLPEQAPLRWSVRASGIACPAVEAALGRFGNSNAKNDPDAVVVAIELASCTSEKREIVTRETVTTEETVAAGPASTTTTKGKCRSTPHQSKSYQCVRQGANGMCAQYDNVVTSSYSTECDADETRSTTRYKKQKSTRVDEKKVPGTVLTIAGQLTMTYRGVTRVEPLADKVETALKDASDSVAAGANTIVYRVEELQKQIAGEEERARYLRSGSVGDLAIEDGRLRMDAKQQYASSETVTLVASTYGLTETQASDVLKRREMKLAEYSPPDSSTLHGATYASSEDEDRRFRASIIARKPKPVVDEPFFDFSFRHTNTLDNLGSFSFGVLNIAQPGAPSTKGFTLGLEGLLSDREELELVYGLGVRLGNAGTVSNGSIIFDGRVNFGAAYTAGPLTLYLLATAAYESYVMARGFVQPEARLLFDLAGGGLELTGGLPLFKRDASDPTQTDARPLRLSARLLLPEGAPFAIAGNYARDPFGTRITIDLAYLFAHRDR